MSQLSKTLDLFPYLLRRHKVVSPFLAMSLCPPIQEVEFNGGARLYADIREPFPRSYFLTKSYDKEYCRLAGAFMSQGGHYFDLGANYGFCAFGMLASAGAPSQSIQSHLFEANPEMCGLLRRSAGDFYPECSVRVIHAAVCDRKGESRFYLKKGHLGGSYLSETGGLIVPNVVLDEYFQNYKIESVDFMKMDIEGAETLALEGGRKIFSAGQVRALYFEVSNETLNRFKTSSPELIEKVRSLDFEVYYVAGKDFKSGIVDLSAAHGLQINNDSIKLSPVKNYPMDRGTDLLALHKTSAHYRRLTR